MSTAITPCGNEVTSMNDAARLAADGAAPARVLRVRHATHYAYGNPVSPAHHLAHLRPRDTPRQTVRDWRLAIDPEPDGGIVDVGRDVFGNWRLAFSHTRLHERLAVVSSFDAELRAAPARSAGEPWEQVADVLRYRSGARIPEACEFALDSPYVRRAPAFAELANGLFTAGRGVVDAAAALMHRIHTDFAYRDDCTDVATDALQSLQLRRGVCQDFAHVMIAALRTQGLAARYVSGYLLTAPAPGQPRLVGADASHAWVAVWCPLEGWVDLDPTNDRIVDTDHVTLAWGRDYGDVAPLRGVIHGSSGAQPQVSVTVTPV
jgi:transglutaminase-like putative cysteine protease